MGSRGASSGKGKGKATASQKATNARDIENMNEAQLDKEIEKTQRIIDFHNTVMENNSLDTAETRAMREAFPLGVGMTTAAQQRKQAQVNERDAKKAAAYTEALDAKKAAETRMQTLQDAKKKVQGTGKTQKQIREDKVKKAVESTPKTLSWKTTQKGGWSNGGYAPKIIKAGNIEIHGSGGLYTVFKDGKQVGRTDKLSKAKAWAERNK